MSQARLRLVGDQKFAAGSEGDPACSDTDTRRRYTSMNLRVRQNSVLNVWPAFTDVSIAMLLIFLFFIFVQFVSNSKLILENS